MSEAQHNQPDASEQLKPCPFCGGTNLEWAGQEGGCVYLICDCGADGPGDCYEADAIIRWNTRKEPTDD